MQIWCLYQDKTKCRPALQYQEAMLVQSACSHFILLFRVVFEVGLVACIFICRDTFSSSGSFLYDNFIKRDPNFVQLVVYLSYTMTLQWITTLSVNTICAFSMVLPGTYICRSLILLRITNLDVIMFLLWEYVLRSIHLNNKKIDSQLQKY